MILKGNQRGGGMQLARHLMNVSDNDHVTLHEVRGFVSPDLAGAFKEAYAISRSTKCRQFLFSLSLSPPETKNVSVEVFEKAIDEVEAKMGLAGQPRAIVFHEKQGRRHAHCVWSRIDIDQMKAINLAHYKLKLRDVSRQLYIENDWRMPLGLVNSREGNPLNISREEWQQASRIKRDPRTIKEAFQDCWAISDGLRAFRHALEARGYHLAQGDRRGFVAVDWQGEVYAVAKWAGVKTRDVRTRLGEPDELPSVDEVRAIVAQKVEQKLRGFATEIKQQFEKAQTGLQAKKELLVARQRHERRVLLKRQDQRLAEEKRKCAQRFNKGLKGVWDWFTGERSKIRKQNEALLNQLQSQLTDEMQCLIDRHITERQELQKQIKALRMRHEAQSSRLTDQVSLQETVRLGIGWNKRARLDPN